MKARASFRSNVLAKSPTGIQGLDEITDGGLPKGRPTLVCGSAGCGKTLLAMEFLVRGATEFKEPGVFMAFEENEKELTENVSSLGFDLHDLVAQKKLVLDHVHIERSEIEETGEFDLEGLFVRLNHAIDTIGAKRVVLDTVESLFAGLPNPLILRSELRRLFRWLKEKRVTSIITGERGDGTLTRQGLEEYVSDCVILLDHRVENQRSIRRLRVVKYRGSKHETNEYPFLIDEDGFSILPITSVGLNHTVTEERLSTGVPRLDTMLGGRGYFRGSSILLSGTAGTGKSSLAAHFVQAACKRGERAQYFAYEESESQIIRNMRSVGIDLEPWVKKKLLQFHVSRPTLLGLENHLTVTRKAFNQFNPQVVVFDPVNSFLTGEEAEVKAMLIRLVDFLKLRGTTTLMTSLTRPGSSLEHTDTNISSLIDTWLLLRDIELGGERNRGLYILKSRGMSHSNQIREFLLTDQGIELRDVYVGSEGVLTGSARLSQELKDRNEALMQEQEIEHRQLLLERKRKSLEAQIETMRAEFEAEEAEARRGLGIEKGKQDQWRQDRTEMARSRKADVTGRSKKKTKRER